ncbi:hypothetical protein AURANDRAFT_59128 [Aureococcus anophagefferens]|uniref:Enoyl reductase (ER) domain-containing protein n=1 Tax=Aureococcus anophagefferens TaxID=44056 RepID=F0YBU0_AURAN|nr:hypothetical protein AURANDRAFT_59128 [Aureococcus anophagefferens]EGB07336.1 hypothetical protein AURANDRAFT_59128 [Aureococcus anophagefferens]|eukprot:XP_009037963.1 hypothetical protein AURANDRAFT_59128 [Aureococcus anophagefferens]
MKGWISTVQNYASVPTGDTMFAFGVGEVVASALDGVAVGALVAGRTGWQEYGAAPRIADPAEPLFRVVDEATAPPSLALGVLGINGLTAYLGLREVGRPKAGETVLCSTAAGAVGAARRSAVGQLAKRAGCRAVGVAGGAAKAALCVDAFAYDACVDYKATGDLGAAVAAACPDGIDVFYDMVGGDQLDAVAPLLNVGARVVVVGTAGTAAWSPPPRGLRLERHLLVKRASMAGFLVFDHAAAFPAALDDLARLVADGSLVHREEVRRGLAAAPRALEDIYRGANAGKLIIAVP